MSLKALQGLRTATYGSGPVDTGNDTLNATLRGQNAMARVADQNQADEDAGAETPWWAQRKLNSPLGLDLGSQLIEAQNEIAETGQKTAMRFETPRMAAVNAGDPYSFSKSQLPPSLLALQHLQRTPVPEKRKR